MMDLGGLQSDGFEGDEGSTNGTWSRLSRFAWLCFEAVLGGGSGD